MGLTFLSGDWMNKKILQILLTTFGILTVSAGIAMLSQDFRNWLWLRSGAEISIYKGDEDKRSKQPLNKKIHYNSQEEWDALSEDQKRVIMDYRMRRDTRSLLGIAKGSEGHRNLLEMEDRRRRAAIEREHGLATD